MTTQQQIRAAFWEQQFPDGVPYKYRGKSQNDLPCDIRLAWCDFVDWLHRNGEISDALAYRATL
jgi:hypothetical protein